ncbi:MAG: 5-bromo-4-chloroindolyl phosphate hydrolysis family protein [Clostridia bacterium]|nr:5-bromo-4-chloroindolyl phosphate hydrolysis family protein [Clostridia bacterium]
MNENKGREGKDFNIDTGLIINLIMLMIPGLRFPGAIWLFSRIRKQYNFRMPGRMLLLVAAAMFIVGSFFEVTEGVVWPIAVFAILIAAAFLVTNTIRGRKQSDTRSAQTQQEILKDDLLAYLQGSSDIFFIDDIIKRMGPGVTEEQIKTAFRQLRREGKLPREAVIDNEKRIIIMTSAARYTSQRTEEAPGGMSAYDRILQSIRDLNDQIPDTVMTQMIHRLESLTATIFHLVEQKPERTKDIQPFMEYYLPTTLRLLSQYAQLERQGDVRGENITTAKRRIEGIMDKVVEGYETQLDRLFKSDAIDITNDIKVLEKMMRMDGLSSRQ